MRFGGSQISLIKNLRPVWFSMRLTNTAHTYNVQELSTPWAPPEGLITPYMSKFKVLNHNHVSWLYKQEPGNSTSRNRDVDSRTVPGLQGGLMRASRGLNENTPWGDPEGWFLSSYLWGGIAGGWRTHPTAQTLPRLSTSPKSLRMRGALTARELAALPPSSRGRDGSGLTASLPCTSCRWSQRGSMKCAATVLCSVYPHPSAF